MYNSRRSISRMALGTTLHMTGPFASEAVAFSARALQQALEVAHLSADDYNYATA